MITYDPDHLAPIKVEPAPAAGRKIVIHQMQTALKEADTMTIPEERIAFIVSAPTSNDAIQLIPAPAPGRHIVIHSLERGASGQFIIEYTEEADTMSTTTSGNNPAGYHIRSSSGAYFGGIQNGERVIWNQQIADAYGRPNYDDLNAARDPRYLRHDPDAQIVALTQDDSGKWTVATTTAPAKRGRKPGTPNPNGGRHPGTAAKTRVDLTAEAAELLAKFAQRVNEARGQATRQDEIASAVIVRHLSDHLYSPDPQEIADLIDKANAQEAGTP